MRETPRSFAVVAAVLALASSCVTYLRGTKLLDYYQFVNALYPERTPLLDKIPPDLPLVTIPNLLVLAVFVAYLIYIRKYFTSQFESASPELT